MFRWKQLGKMELSFIEKEETVVIVNGEDQELRTGKMNFARPSAHLG